MNLKTRIMIRIYVLFFIRKLKNPIIFCMSVFGLSFLSLAYMVSLDRLLANSPRDLNGMYHFWVSAFIATKFLVKTFVLILVATIVLPTISFAKKTGDFVQGTTNKLFARA